MTDEVERAKALATRLSYWASTFAQSYQDDDDISVEPEDAVEMAEAADLLDALAARLREGAPLPELGPNACVSLPYTNWRGETAVRRITPLRLWFGSTEWHPERQWMLTAYDEDKGAERDFALSGFAARLEPPEGVAGLIIWLEIKQAEAVEEWERSPLRGTVFESRRPTKHGEAAAALTALAARVQEAEARYAKLREYARQCDIDAAENDWAISPRPALDGEDTR